MPMFSIEPVRSEKGLKAAKRLFAAYAASLPVDLIYQDFSSELADLPGKYAPPAGELLVAWSTSGSAIGCVGLRPVDEGKSGEMKRLYVSNNARSLGLGRALASAVIHAARERGYSQLLLDTLPTMAAAAALYESLGFERIEPYYEPTPPGTIFMRLHLDVAG